MIGVFGNITPLSDYQSINTPGLGFANLVSNLLALLSILGGIFVLINAIAAGYQYMNSLGEPQKLVAAGNKILYSIIGLAIIAAAYIIAGLVGFIIFKDATFLLNPTFFSTGP